MHRPLLDTSLAALPPIPPDIGENREARFLARLNATTIHAPDRITTVDLWAVECRGRDYDGRRCRVWLNVCMRHDEFHPPPAPELCGYCRAMSGHYYSPKGPSIDAAREWLKQAKRNYYEHMVAEAYYGVGDDAFVRAELHDAIDLLSARIREAAGHPPLTNRDKAHGCPATARTALGRAAATEILS
jgi:hypothetical protein